MSREIKRDPYQCVGKEPFDSFERANKVAKRRRRARDAFKGQRPYKCEICGKWHIGTTK